MDKSSKFLLSVSFAAVVLLAGVIAILIDAFTNVPDFREMRSKVVVPIKLSDRTWTTRVMGPKAPGWVPVSQISNHVLMAVIASEDTSFFSHKGVDYHELQEAIKKDWEEKRWARGASTLTQQVVKNVYLGRQKTLWRKFKEFLWAREIEKVLSKTEILCFYLNMVEWGPDIYGIRAAASHYFGTSPALITAKQAAFLAVLLPSPIKYHVYFKKKELTPWSRGRVAQVLRVMNQMGFIDDAIYSAALTERLWGVTGELGPQKGVGGVLPEEDPNQSVEESKAVDVLSEPTESKKPVPLDEVQDPNHDPQSQPNAKSTAGELPPAAEESVIPENPPEAAITDQPSP